MYIFMYKCMCYTRYILYQYGCSNTKLKVFETRFIKKLPGREVYFHQI